MRPKSTPDNDISISLESGLLFALGNQEGLYNDSLWESFKVHPKQKNKMLLSISLI